MLRQFSYDYQSGPFESERDLAGPWNVGNCRRAVQHYFYSNHALFLSRDHALYPDLLWKTGSFVIYHGDPIDFGILQTGDIIFADRVRTKVLNVGGKSTQLCGPDNFFMSLHTAIYTGVRCQEIWHSAKLEGGSGYWSLQEFLQHYRLIAVKRIIDDARGSHQL